MTLEKKLTGLSLVGLAATALATPAFAQTAPPAPNTGNISVAAGMDIVTSYIFRGYEQENQGLILQPYAEIGAPLGETGIDLTVGTWHSLHSAGTGSDGNGPSRWYEADLYASLGYAINDKVAVSVGYTGYHYPNGAFNSIDELNFGVSYDDSELLGDWALNPYAMLAVEIRDAGGDEGSYLELGGELGAPFIESEDIPVEISFPIAIGLSVDDYYQDVDGDNEFFGFLLIGAAASMPLDDFIPASYGTWAVSAGVDVIFVNDDANLLSDGDDVELVGKVGIGMEY